MAELAPVVEFEFPARDGGVLVVPPAGEFERLGAANAALLDAAEVSLGGLGLRAFRALARSELVGAAQRATAGWQIAAPGLDPARPLVITGHQPLLFHPGIWLKTLLLESCCGGRGLNLVVDSDCVPEVGVDVPLRVEGLGRARVTLAAPPDEVPLEAMPAPTGVQWEEFLTRVRAHVGTVDRTLVERVDLFADLSRPVRARSTTLAEFLARARRAAEPPGRYLELPISIASGTEAFRRFAWDVLRHPARFADVYNAALEAHRARQGIRNAANPFPNLLRDGDLVESPFWVVVEGRRAPVFARAAGVDVEVWATGRLRAVMPSGDADAGAAALAGVPLRPRALTLTMVFRLIGDLFIHGVGGGRYDRVTDAVIGDWLGVAPPRYAVATGTFFLPLAPTPSARVVRRLEGALLDLRHNPDRYLADPPPEARALVEEKWRLIARLDAQLTKRERRDVTRRIREINARVAAFVGIQMAEVEAALAGARAGRAEAEVTEERGYPFFLHDRARIEAALARA